MSGREVIRNISDLIDVQTQGRIPYEHLITVSIKNWTQPAFDWLPPDMPVVETHCGKGWLGAHLPERIKPNHIQTDIDPENIATVNQIRNPAQPAFVADASKLSEFFAPESVGVFIDYNEINNQPSRGKLAILKDRYKCLTPGGWTVSMLDAQPSLNAIASRYKSKV